MSETVFQQSPFNKQRNDKFLMIINTPKGMKNIAGVTRTNDTVIPESLTMSVYGAIAPDVVIPPVTIRYAGQTLNTSSGAHEPYSPQVVNFVIDNRFNNYWFIYKWLSILNNDKLSIKDADNVFKLERSSPGIETAMKDYFTDISIFALDEYEKRVVEFKYTQAFPTKLSGISFNYRQGNEVECTLEFAYSQFYATLVESVETL